MEYIHGTHPEEQRRLSLLNDLMNERSLREIGLRGERRILDVGCGLGQLTAALAHAAGPESFVLGIDRSAEQLSRARALAAGRQDGGQVELRHGDAANLPLSQGEWGSFDLAHTRFVLEHVRDPLAVVRCMVRAVRAGGRIVLEDEDHEIFRVWPELPALVPTWKAYCEAYVRLGNDPLVGRKLVALLHAAGAEPRRNSWIFFGSCSGSPAFESFVDNIVALLRGARGQVLEMQRIAPGEFDRGVEALDAWKRRPDAAMWFAMAYAEGVRPG